MGDHRQAAIDAATEAVGAAMITRQSTLAIACAGLEAAEPHLAAAERERLREFLLSGDPSRLESAFRQVVDDEEAADCALIVADLLKDEP